MEKIKDDKNENIKDLGDKLIKRINDKLKVYRNRISARRSVLKLKE